ncbi:MAG: hypothetical protein HQK65_14530 [Desulfamplus sp.]|nr:hypothetical protein [Desulfamplus sp.]
MYQAIPITDSNGNLLGNIYFNDLLCFNNNQKAKNWDISIINLSGAQPLFVNIPSINNNGGAVLKLKGQDNIQIQQVGGLNRGNIDFSYNANNCPQSQYVINLTINNIAIPINVQFICLKNIIQIHAQKTVNRRDIDVTAVNPCNKLITINITAGKGNTSVKIASKAPPQLIKLPLPDFNRYSILKSVTKAINIKHSLDGCGEKLINTVTIKYTSAWKPYIIGSFLIVLLKLFYMLYIYLNDIKI